MFSLIPVDHDPFADPPFKLIPVDHDPFAVGPVAQPADPGIAAAGTAAPQLVPVDHDPFAAAPANALPHIIVHPKSPNAPPDNPADADGPDDWFVPTADGYPDDWFVPAPAATPAQSGPGAQPNAAVPPVSNPPAVWPDPSAAFWSLIPASRAGAMAWAPPIFPGASPTFPLDGSTTLASPGWPATGIPNIRTSGGLFDGLAQLAPANPYPEFARPFGGLLSPPAAAVPSSPGIGSVLPTALPQSADPQPVSPTARPPISDYSAGEIAGDAAKSFGVGVGRVGIQSAGFLGDVREALARGAQRAADYLAPGFAPNAGATVSDYLASYPLLGGPTSSQLQSAVESYTGPLYQPKTIVGDYAETAGEFVPGALLMPEGSLAANALRYGLLPAISSETAGQLTKGTAAEPWARAVGGILGAAANTWGALPRARSGLLDESASRATGSAEGTTSKLPPSDKEGPTYLYQKIGANGEHLKFGVTKSPNTRYTQKMLGGGRLKIIAQGSRQEMLELERNLHETLPIGPEEGQKFYIQIQINKGLRPPPY